MIYSQNQQESYSLQYKHNPNLEQWDVLFYLKLTSEGGILDLTWNTFLVRSWSWFVDVFSMWWADSLLELAIIWKLSKSYKALISHTMSGFNYSPRW